MRWGGGERVICNREESVVSIMITLIGWACAGVWSTVSIDSSAQCDHHVACTPRRTSSSLFLSITAKSFIFCDSTFSFSAICLATSTVRCWLIIACTTNAHTSTQPTISPYSHRLHTHRHTHLAASTLPIRYTPRRGGIGVRREITLKVIKECGFHFERENMCRYTGAYGDTS